MTGEQAISAPREKIWAGLNDPEVLKQCIMGCESVQKTDDQNFEALVVARIGPVKAKFSGKIALSDIVPLESYTITGEGKGGVAGMAKGGATVMLIPSGDNTVLSYDVKAQVAGKLAQIGSRLIDATFKKFADQFFKRFRRIMEADQADDSVGDSATQSPIISSRDHDNFKMASGSHDRLHSHTIVRDDVRRIQIFCSLNLIIFAFVLLLFTMN